MVNAYQYGRTAERVEAIAGELIKISRAGYDGPAGRRQIESDFSHILIAGERTSADEAMIDAEMRKRISEFERGLELRAIALLEELVPLDGVIAQGFDEMRPKRDVSNPAEIMLSRERWDAVRERLEAGQGLGDVINGVDLPTLLAIEYFAPGYLLKSPNSDHDEESARDQVKKLVMTRLVEVASEDVRNLLGVARRAQGFSAIAWEWAKQLHNRFSGHATSDELLAAAVQSEYIAREYGIRPTPAQERAERNTSASEEASTGFTMVSRWGERARARG